MINEETILKIENIFKCKFMSWQKDYLLGNPIDFSCVPPRCGKTFTRALGFCLSEGKPIHLVAVDDPNEEEIRKYMGEDWYNMYAYREFILIVQDVYNQLKKNGIHVREITGFNKKAYGNFWESLHKRKK